MCNPHVACLVFVFFAGRLAMPLVRHGFQGTPRSFFRASATGLQRRARKESVEKMSTGQNAAENGNNATDHAVTLPNSLGEESDHIPVVGGQTQTEHPDLDEDDFAHEEFQEDEALNQNSEENEPATSAEGSTVNEDAVPQIEEGAREGTVAIIGHGAQKTDAQQSQTASIVIPLSVYTATNGYDWSNIPDGADRDGLDYFYQKAVAFKPDFMVAGDVVKGVFTKDGCVAAFRIQIVKRWDCFGRNADYCAFAFVGAEDAKLIDFDALLEQPELSEPTHTPPVSVRYVGEFSKDVNSDGSKLSIKRLFNGEELNDFDFSKIGALISTYGGKCDEWLFSKVQSAYENSILVKTKGWREDPFPPPPPPSEPEPSPIQEVRSPSSAQLIAPVVGEIPQPDTEKEVKDTRLLDKPSVVQGVPVQYQVVKTRSLNTGATYRTPTQGQNYRLRGDTYMRPVTQKMEMANNLVNDSSKSESIDWLQLTLISLCVLVIVLLVVVIFLLRFSNNIKTAEIGDANVEQRSNGELPIMDLGETSDSNPKGGK